MSFSPSKIQKVAFYFVSELRSVTRTKLVKLIYLADYLSYSAYGHQLTDAEYRRQQRGPLPVKFDESINEMRGFEVELSEKPMFDGKMLIHRPGPHPRFEPTFPGQDKVVLDNILAWYGQLTGKVVTEIAYQTKPMTAILKKEAELHCSLLREPIKFSHYLPELRMKRLKERYAQIQANRPELTEQNKKALEERDAEAYHWSEGFRRMSLSKLLAQPVA